MSANDRDLERDLRQRVAGALARNKAPVEVGRLVQQYTDVVMRQATPGWEAAVAVPDLGMRCVGVFGTSPTDPVHPWSENGRQRDWGAFWNDRVRDFNQSGTGAALIVNRPPSEGQGLEQFNALILIQDRQLVKTVDQRVLIPHHLLAPLYIAQLVIEGR